MHIALSCIAPITKDRCNINIRNNSIGKNTKIVSLNLYKSVLSLCIINAIIYTIIDVVIGKYIVKLIASDITTNPFIIIIKPPVL